MTTGASAPTRGDGPAVALAAVRVRLVLVALLLVLAAGGWWWSVQQMDGMDDGPWTTLGSFSWFITVWIVMMAAMMLPSALPLVFEFAQHTERRRGWRAATTLLGATYLGVWLVFGVVCYLLYNAVAMPWPNQGLIGGAALVFAGVYALTPLKRASEALCRERCALHGPLPFNLMRGAVVAGARYGLSCLGCSAGLMVAMVLIGMSNLLWTIVLAVIVLVYKLAPAPMPPSLVASSGVLVAFGLLYAVAG